MIDVKIKKLSKNAVIPTYAKPGDAGMDLVCTQIVSSIDSIVTYGTGISVKIPEGFVGLIFPRSSIYKYDQLLANAVGVIDSGYTGEIMCKFRNTKDAPHELYSVGDRIAQLIIIPYPSIRFMEVDELESTERGNGGFGSSGT